MLTEIIDLPSKGNLYPKDHPLADGKIEIKHMTARDEDILTTESFIKNNVVMDKLLDSIIVNDDIDIGDILVGDKQKIILQTRILAYGSEYDFTYRDTKHTIDLTELGEVGKPEMFDHDRFVEFDLDKSGKTVKLKVLNNRESKKITEEINALKKKNQAVGEVTTRLYHIIEEVDGNSNEGDIREFVNKELLASDSLAIRLFLDAITPDVDFTVDLDGEEVEIPIGINFLYPSARV